MSAIEACFQAARPSDDELKRPGLLTITYGDFAPKVMSTSCRSEVMCKCLRAHAPTTLALEPTKKLGGFTVTVFVRP